MKLCMDIVFLTFQQGLKEIDLQMSNYMQILEIAVQHGLPVLLKNVHETLDAALDPILTKSVMKIGQSILFLQL